MDFECPFDMGKKFVDGRYEKTKIPLYPKCWVTFHQDYMQIMDRQKIMRKDVLRYWYQDEGFVGAGIVLFPTHHFVYKDKNNMTKLFVIK